MITGLPPDEIIELGLLLRIGMISDLDAERHARMVRLMAQVVIEDRAMVEQFRTLLITED